MCLIKNKYYEGSDNMHSSNHTRVIYSIPVITFDKFQGATYAAFILAKQAI